MTSCTRIAALLALFSGLLLVSCSSTQSASPHISPAASKRSATTASPALAANGKVPKDPACNKRTSPHPGFYRKGGSLRAVVKTTAYCHLEADSLKYGKRNAVGSDLRYDSVRSAAADWSVFPVGTLFRIVGQPHTYRIDDYGSALVGTRTIDLYQPTKAHMNAWGARMVEIEILKWGSYSHGQTILAGRSKHAHVKAMLNSMSRKHLVAKR